MDLTDLKDILRILEEQEITEFELEQDGVKLRVCRSTTATVSTVAPAEPVYAAPPVPAPPVAGPGGAEPAPEAKPDAPGTAGAEDPGASGTEVPSPIVGTFYRAPDPNSAAFVNVGDQVQVGQVLCIIEAMKLMNEIEAEVAGEVVKIYPENGQPVQYGDTLFTIRPA